MKSPSLSISAFEGTLILQIPTDLSYRKSIEDAEPPSL
jgi:hypothetical protein